MNLICYIYYPNAVSHIFRLIALLQRQLRLSEVVIVYSRSNIGTLSPPPSGATFRLLPYDGAGWEFGAYQLGLDQLSRQEAKGVLVLNDTAGRNYPLFQSNLRELARLCKETVLEPHPVLAGKLESQGQNFAIHGLSFTSWIRSNIFYINRAGLEALSWRLFDPEVFAAPTCHDGVVSTGGITSANLESHIATWLGAGAHKQGWVAHADKAAVSDSLLSRKAGSILLEKYLSARIVAAKGRVLDYDESRGYRLAWVKLKVFYLKRRIDRLFN
jgi:hypothetical protein